MQSELELSALINTLFGLPQTQKPQKDEYCHLRIASLYCTVIHSPSWMFWYRIVTCLSRSCRLCSWRKPRECISSWIARPLFSHPEPSDSCCLPPRIPTWDQHLWKRGILVNSLLHPSRNRIHICSKEGKRENIDERNRRVQVIHLA